MKEETRFCNEVKTNTQSRYPPCFFCVRKKGHTGMHWDYTGNQWIKD